MKWLGRSTHSFETCGWLLLSILDIGVNSFPDLVCQLETVPGETLQKHMNFTCNISTPFCQCETIFDDPYYAKRLTNQSMIPINETINKTIESLEPGEFYFTDRHLRCVLGEVASYDIWQTSETALAPPFPCPPGFFCGGGFAQPRSCYQGDHCPFKTRGERKDRLCHEGHFCHTPVEPMLICPDGGTCPAGSYLPNGCPAGYYCRSGHTKLCPAGSYCPFGSDTPVKCPSWTICNDGSGFKDLTIICSCILAGGAIVTICAARYYEHLITKRIGRVFLCVVFLGISISSWIVDSAIGIFLVVNYVIVVCNWLPSQVRLPQLAARSFLVATLMGVVVTLWFWHPQMSIFLAGMVVLGFIGFLMSRESRVPKYIGRCLLGLCCVSLIGVMWRIDFNFTIGYFTFIAVLAFFCLLGSWMFNLVKVSCGRGMVWRCFFTLQGEEEDDNRDQDVGANATNGQRVSRRDGIGAGLSTRLRPATETSPCMSLTSSRSGEVSSQPFSIGIDSMTSEERKAGKGVSFQLSNVNFELPDGRALLTDITLSVSRGRRVAVMGPSGSGKSTLLAVLSGLASYGRVKGEIRVSGRKRKDLAFLRHVTGYVPQDDVLHGELSVRENVSFQAALRLESDKTEADIEGAVAEVLANLGLSQLADARVGTVEKRGVSGGQRKRVSIAMELVGKPLLLFADEPTSGLDSTTAHEVVSALNRGADKIGATVIAVIHQPRYETLCLFDDLVLLGAGGFLVYADSTTEIVNYFEQHLGVIFDARKNPADVILDEIHLSEDTGNGELSYSRSPKDCADIWRQYIETKECAPQHESTPQREFHRPRLPLVRSTLVFMDRSMRQLIRSYPTLLVNYLLIMGSTIIVCTLVDNEQFGQFLWQASFVALSLMLLQGVAAQRTFGADLLITWREAQVGVPVLPYFLGKDLASLFEITVSSIVFTATYGAWSHMEMSLISLFIGTWSFIYSVTGLNFIFSIVMGATAAQMSAVVAAFVCFCVAGVSNPPVPDMVGYLNGRGWMIPALSPVRWFVGYLITQEAKYLTPLTRQVAEGQFNYMGYDLDKLNDFCKGPEIGKFDYEESLRLPELWASGGCWVCSVSELILLGILFRYVAGMCLILYVSAHRTGWASFFTRTPGDIFNLRRLIGKVYSLLVAAFVVMFLFGEIWVLGWTNAHTWHWHL